MTVSPNEILIYGAGDQALVTRDAILKQGSYRISGYIVDGQDGTGGQHFLDAPIYRFDDLERRRPTLPQNFIVAIGDNAIRREKTRLMEALGFSPATVIHPFSSIGSDSTLGRGVLVCASAVMDPNVIVCDGAIINGNACVGHGSRIGAFVHLGGGAIVGGNCVVEELAFIGMCAGVLSGRTIGRNAFVGAGALVTKDVPDNSLAIGIPARLRTRQLA